MLKYTYAAYLPTEERHGADRLIDGTFLSFEGEHGKHGWGEYSRREGSADKRWGALISLAVSSPHSFLTINPE